MGIQLTREGSTGIITLDFPPVNALNSHAYFELYEVMYNLAVDDGVSVVIITGAGDRAFVAGSDVKEFVSFNGDTGSIYTQKNGRIREYIRNFPKPVICAVNGLALGGGFALALMCDIRIASENAKFSLSEINMGIIGGVPYAALIGASGTVRKMIFSGENITADEALRAGLVDEVVSPEELLPRSLKLAERIGRKPPVAVRKAKEVLTFAAEHSLMETVKAEEEAIRDLWDTEDKTEAVSAFLEKRRPSFSGK